MQKINETLNGKTQKTHTHVYIYIYIYTRTHTHIYIVVKQTLTYPSTRLRIASTLALLDGGSNVCSSPFALGRESPSMRISYRQDSILSTTASRGSSAMQDCVCMCVYVCMYVCVRISYKQDSILSTTASIGSCAMQDCVYVCMYVCMYV